MRQLLILIFTGFFLLGCKTSNQNPEISSRSIHPETKNLEKIPIPKTPLLSEKNKSLEKNKAFSKSPVNPKNEIKTGRYDPTPKEIEALRKKSKTVTPPPGFARDIKVEQAFLDRGLKTNTAIRDIPLSEVLGGGPVKDGIPALTNPKNWESVTSASHWMGPDNLGILVEILDEQRFYPYDVLYWHEIVNDTIGDQKIAVTFCPLCGSVLVFDRQLNHEVLTFGVSGKLWESNLLMYDQKTESLWSQILGKAMVGSRAGDKLELLKKTILSFEELKQNFPQAKVLSKNTGYDRPYGDSPYGDYERNEQLMFPVKNTNPDFPKKEIFHIVSVNENISVGFQRKKLLEEKSAALDIFVQGKKQKIKAEVLPNGKINFTLGEQKLPDYVAMWFSWQTHQDGQKFVWP